MLFSDVNFIEDLKQHTVIGIEFQSADNVVRVRGGNIIEGSESGTQGNRLIVGQIVGALRRLFVYFSPIHNEVNKVSSPMLEVILMPRNIDRCRRGSCSVLQCGRLEIY